jgi:hypothetical protein
LASVRRLSSPFLRPVLALRERLQLPAEARAERRRDHAGLPSEDPGIDRAVEAALGWLSRAQDASLSGDGGVARHFSLVDGWSSSYPETTGYIVPTLLQCAQRYQRPDLRDRALRMLDWLASIQLADGGFQGGLVDATPVASVTFNTGQILLGLASGAQAFGDAYRDPLRRAAVWLVDTQDVDGCWRKHPSPFAMHGEKTYDTHVAWGLFEAARVAAEPKYLAAGLANVRWALSRCRSNGWFEDCCLSDPMRPLTHTIGYALRGVLEAYRATRDPDLLAAGRRTADGLVSALGGDGFLPGRLGADWRGAVPWACLTGSVQVAACWLLLYQWTGDERYREAAYAANRFTRRTMRLDGAPEMIGGISGSFPIDAEYGRFEFLNWAGKFFIDAQMLESAVRSGAAAAE